MNATTAFSRYARYYDLLNDGKDYAAEAQFVDRLLRPAGTPAGTLLDVGCGTGAHAREFAKLGWSVSGVDLSPAMVEIARAANTAEDGTEFFVGPADKFDLGRRFSAVVSLFHVVSYLSGRGEVFRMLVNVRRHLEPGGLFVFDFWHGPGVLADPPAVRVRRAENNSLHVIRIAETTHRPVECLVDVRYEIMVEDEAAARVEHITESHCLRYFFLPELDFILQCAGFRIERTRAGLTAEELGPRAWHGLVVARAL